MYSKIEKTANMHYTINSKGHKIHIILRRHSGTTVVLLHYRARGQSSILISGALCDTVGFLQVLWFTNSILHNKDIS